MFTVNTVFNFAQENIHTIGGCTCSMCLKLNAEGIALFVFSKTGNSPVTPLINVLCYKSDARAAKEII